MGVIAHKNEATSDNNIHKLSFKKANIIWEPFVFNIYIKMFEWKQINCLLLHIAKLLKKVHRAVFMIRILSGYITIDLLNRKFAEFL